MEIRLYFADVEALHDPLLFQQLYQSVSEERRQAVDRLRPAAGKLLSLGAGALLEASLAELGVSSPRPARDQNGKQYLPERDDLCFNISHSGTKVLCAVSGRAVGCDLERIRAARLAVARRCFCPEEYQALLDCPDEAERDRLFYRYWTLKESFLKAIGSGLRISLNAFCILPEGDEIRVRQTLDPRQFAFRSFTVDGYQFALCSADQSAEGVRLEERSFSELAELL